jgi:23S rRNA pseudouridine1911/1915/1917 synthase
MDRGAAHADAHIRSDGGGAAVIKKLTVAEEQAGSRLDVYIAEHLPDFSRARIQKLMAMHGITVNGEPVKANYRTREGDAIVVDIPSMRPLERANPEPIPLDIVYEDSSIVVVNKPKGMVVHPAPGAETGTLVNALLAHCQDLSGIGGTLRPGIVHRLDKDTSGLLVVAKNDQAHESLTKQIQARTAVRKYHALLWGKLPFKHAVIDAPIARHPGDRKRMTVYQEGPPLRQEEHPITGPKIGRDAVTEVRLLEHLADFSWVEAILQTGRTHQIRVHCAFAGYPVVGDASYGGQRKVSADILRGVALQSVNHYLSNLHGQALHAYFLSFDHPKTLRRLQFHAPLPDEIAELLDFLRRVNEAMEG